MRDELDLIKAFEGLYPEQVKELTARIQNAVQREVENFTRAPAASAGEQPKKEIPMTTLDVRKLFEGLSDEEKGRALEALSPEEQVDLFKSLTNTEQPSLGLGQTSVDQQLASNAARLKRMYREPSKFRELIARLEEENEPLYYAHDLERAKARDAAPSQAANVALLERQRETLLEELQKYHKHPSKYKARVSAIYAELDGIDQKVREAKA